MRFFVPVRMRTSIARWRSSSRSSRAWALDRCARGSRSARSNCAKVAASILSVLMRAEAIALVLSG